MNVVVIVSGGLTETLQATPLLRTLRAGLPDATITLAAPRRAATVSERLPAVDDTICLRGLDYRSGPLGFIAAWLALRRRRIDIAVVCSDRWRDAALTYAVGAPRRVGVSKALTALLFSDHLRARRGNNAEVWIELAGLLGISVTPHRPGFKASDSARSRIDGLLTTAGIESERILIAMAPGSGGADSLGVASRELRWAPDRYAHLANQMALRHGAAVVLVGPETDRVAVNATLVDIGALHLDLCGELDVDEMAALLARCDLLVCSDSPLLHLAAAMGTPAVGLFGPTDGRRRGPYGPAHRVVQAMPESNGSRHPATLDRIRVEDVLAGIEASL